MSSPSRCRSRGRACSALSTRSALSACSAVFFVLFFSACHPSPRPATAARLSPVQRLQHDIDDILAAPALEHSIWGVLVTSLAKPGDDETLYSVHARTLLMPASNMKIVTLAATAARLGWDFHYETRILAAGPIEGGVLHGDLIVVGSGDPSIGSRDGSATHVFDAWADNLKGLGLRRVEGRIIGDDNRFEDETLGAGWTWDDLSEGYAAGIGALQFNENSVRATIAPGVAAGDEAIVSVDPPGSGLVVHNRLTTTAAGSTPAIDAYRLPGSSQLELRGSVPLGSAPTTHTLSVDNPTQFFVTVLRHTLIAHGVGVDGPAVDIDDITDRPSRDGATVLFYHRSPPLSMLATTLMKVSQNLYAETFLKTVSAVAGTGAGTANGGRAAVRETLHGWGVEDGGLIMRDGSGLSRYNYVTPQTLVTILTHVDGDKVLRDAFESALPIAGRDGTLSKRMAGTPAEGNAHAKTGSIANARALSGYVTDADGERLVFSIIANNFETPASMIEQTSDQIVVRLAQFTRK
jgi:D-alanyl-D-alanine carboxypeptidase/D-alanyl-D-alanine-endopeptidase (penicillin-binding protein 4)